MIRLFCYSTTALASRAPSPGEAPGLLSCLLHSGVLGTQQHLSVWVGGVSLPLTQEGEQAVCSWQCAPEVEMEIRLHQHTRTIKAWRGWWRAGALVQVGTLPLQVFLEGQAQPVASAATLPVAEASPVPSMTLDQRNGTSALYASAAATAVVERPAALAPSPPALPPAEASGEEAGDLWEVDLAAMRQAAAVTQEEEQDVPEQAAEREQPVAVPPASPLATDTPSSAGTARETMGIAPAIAAMAVRAAGSHAEQERMLEQLATLLASMSPKTILVDLRQHARTARVQPSRRATPRSGSGLGLSKELLRGLYGARYWERGGRIPMTLHQVSARPARWHLVISDPQAPGLQELLAQLAAGMSLVILESEITYAGSTRAAVIAFVREHCPHVTIGPCS